MVIAHIPDGAPRGYLADGARDALLNVPVCAGSVVANNARRKLNDDGGRLIAAVAPGTAASVLSVSAANEGTTLMAVIARRRWRLTPAPTNADDTSATHFLNTWFNGERIGAALLLLE